MKIGVIVAMDKELQLLLPLLGEMSSEDVNGYSFYSGKLSNSEIVAMKCGIGKVNAALGASTLIDSYSPDLVINTGVAGGAGGSAGILDIVVGKRIAYHDVWCGPGTEWGDAAGCPRFFLTSDWVNSLSCLKEDSTVKHGLICSGDIFISQPEEVARIKSMYPEVDAVDMESGAIAQTCYLKNVPFACIRVISDTPGAADNISQYNNFWDEAPRHTFEMLRRVIEQIEL